MGTVNVNIMGLVVHKGRHQNFDIKGGGRGEIKFAVWKTFKGGLSYGLTLVKTPVIEESSSTKYLYFI